MPVNDIIATTAGLPSAGLDAWRDCVQARMTRGFEISTSSADFRTELRSFEFAGACLWFLTSDAQRVRRSRPARHGSIPVGIFVLEGAARLEQGRRACALEAGSFAFVDAAQPMNFEHDRSFKEIYFQLPKSAVPASLLQRASAQPMSSASLLDRPLFDCVRNIWRAAPALAPSAFCTAVNALVSLSLMTSAFRVDQGDPDSVAVRVRRAMDYIEDHLGDAELNAESVAAAQKVSRRYLDQLFARTGHRVDSWIWERRLQRAANELSASGGPRKTLLRIALDLGFKDPSHFSRKYSRRYGLPPSHHRRSSSATSDIGGSPA